MIPWKELENKLAGDAGRSGPGLVGVAAQITDPRVQQMSPGDIQASRRMTLAVSPLTLAPPDNHNVSPPSFSGIWAHSGQGHPKLRRGKNLRKEVIGWLLPVQPYCLLIMYILEFKSQPSGFLLLLQYMEVFYLEVRSPGHLSMLPLPPLWKEYKSIR